MSGPKDIFLDAIDLSPADRDEFLAVRCGDDADLRAEVERLLDAHRGSEDVFGEASFAVPGLEGGDRIGPYELIEEIGEGGFAVVWRAGQTEPLRRTVALKVLKPGLETRQVVARFEAERHALAMMDHPGIAKVLDGGVTDAGRPWFSMELVDGRTITEHCDAEGLGKRERLELFLEVCRAVQHAHQKGVVHRDLKPSNILVTTVDGRAVPKVIDFGIAKAIEKPLGGATVLTLEGQVIGTPAYMSPEQVDETTDIDTRADVYALGVLLYELLCGERPFRDETLQEAGFAEVLRIIREVEPPRPSTRGSSTTTNVVPREIRGDLDWIVMCCLEKDRDRRYDSAGVLGNEIQRHLGGEPVLAGPPDLAYRARKFASRHRTPLLFAATVAVLLVVGVIAAVTQLVRARAAETRKDVEIAKLVGLSSFLESILTGVDPAVAQGEDTTLMVQVLEDAAARVDTELADVPEVEATVRNAIAKTYMSVGRPDEAEAEFRRALEIREASMTEDDELRHITAQELGTLLMSEGQLDEAEPLLESATAELARILGPDDERALRAATELATLRRLQGDLDESERLHRDLLDRCVRLFGEAGEISIKARNNLAMVLSDKGEVPEAIELLQHAVELQLDENGELHPDALISLNNLGGAQRRLGRNGEAAESLERALELKNRVLPDGHPSRVLSYNNLAMLRRDLGDVDGALELFDEAVTMIDRAGVESSTRAIQLRYNQAITLDQSGDPESALGAHELCAELAAERLGEHDSLTLTMNGAMGWQMVKVGLVEDAEVVLEDNLVALDETDPDNAASRAVARIRLGVARKELGLNDEAKVMLEEGLEMLTGSGSTLAAGNWRMVAARALREL